MKSIETAETNKATIENISIGDCEDAAKLLHWLIDRETLYEVVLHTDNLDIYKVVDCYNDRRYFDEAYAFAMQLALTL